MCSFQLTPWRSADRRLRKKPLPYLSFTIVTRILYINILLSLVICVHARLYEGKACGFAIFTMKRQWFWLSLSLSRCSDQLESIAHVKRACERDLRFLLLCFSIRVGYTFSAHSATLSIDLIALSFCPFRLLSRPSALLFLPLFCILRMIIVELFASLVLYSIFSFSLFYSFLNGPIACYSLFPNSTRSGAVLNFHIPKCIFMLHRLILKRNNLSIIQNYFLDCSPYTRTLIPFWMRETTTKKINHVSLFSLW